MQHETSAQQALPLLLHPESSSDPDLRSRVTLNCDAVIGLTGTKQSCINADEDNHGG